MTLKCNVKCLSAAALIAIAVGKPALAEQFYTLSIAVGGGNLVGYNLTALEDVGYPSSINDPASIDRHISRGTNVTFDGEWSFTVGRGRYFERNQSFGYELGISVSKLEFNRQNVGITFLDGHTVLGYDTVVEDQLPADFYIGEIYADLLYRFSAVQALNNARPYLGIGPSLQVVYWEGTGDSCRYVSPDAVVRASGSDFCRVGPQSSSGQGLGYNVKAGFEIPYTESISLKFEYKLAFGSLELDNFRSFFDIDVDTRVGQASVGLAWHY